MTAAAGRRTEVPRPDTHEMVIIHRAFRRESRLLAALIADVPAADTDRARVLAAHLRWYQLGVHNHHTGEDELIWPLLLARVDLEADVVVRMEAQHERVSQTLARAAAALQEWESSAAAAARDDLVAALIDHRAILVEHLDDEEVHLLPLAARYLTVAEWSAMGEHFLAHTPRRHLLVSLGAVLEEADPAERAAVLGALPRPARLVWHTVGRAVYARRLRQVRGRRPSPAAARTPAVRNSDKEGKR
jgi:hemerythrin-like domain-containing protein